MAVMYVWTKNQDSLGHVSLKLTDDDNTYISWWPQENKSKQGVFKANTKNRLPVNYKEDITANYMGRNCTYRYNLENINQNNIRKWWNKIKGVDQYHLLINNCCDVVVDALREGGTRIPTVFVRTPECMDMLGRELTNTPFLPDDEWTADDHMEMHYLFLKY